MLMLMNTILCYLQAPCRPEKVNPMPARQELVDIQFEESTVPEMDHEQGESCDGV